MKFCWYYVRFLGHAWVEQTERRPYRDESEALSNVVLPDGTIIVPTGRRECAYCGRTK